MSGKVKEMREQITLEEIKAIIDLIRQSESVTDFTLKYGDVEISLSRGGNNKVLVSANTLPSELRTPPKVALTVSPPPEEAPIAGETHIKADIQPGDGDVMVKAPMLGTFYRCPKPGDPPFVEVGDTVREDSVLCIIEVMKLMNSLEAKVKGVVTRILVEDAQPVEYGQPLMIIKVDGA
jgi:acetyl-CoA carboxylase biotin carboxyl carrier protein